MVKPPTVLSTELSRLSWNKPSSRDTFIPDSQTVFTLTQLGLELLLIADNVNYFQEWLYKICYNSTSFHTLLIRLFKITYTHFEKHKLSFLGTDPGKNDYIRLSINFNLAWSTSDQDSTVLSSYSSWLLMMLGFFGVIVALKMYILSTVLLKKGLHH